MSDADLKAAPPRSLHIPTVLGAVVVTYNVASIAQPIRLSPAVVADIFLGKIKKWDDANIKQDNPGVHLPRQTSLSYIGLTVAARPTFSQTIFQKSALNGKKRSD
jgi:ABC-type phosphate transport system substrate-binding protein